MADRLLIHKPTGVLYIWQHQFAQREDFEEVINVESKVISSDDEIPRFVASKPVAAAGKKSKEKVAEPLADLGQEARKGMP